MKIVTLPLAALVCGTMLAQVPPLEGGERRIVGVVSEGVAEGTKQHRLPVAAFTDTDGELLFPGVSGEAVSGEPMDERDHLLVGGEYLLEEPLPPRSLRVRVERDSG